VDAETQAREQGWVPKTEWKGPVEKWVEAEVFLDRGETFLPIVKANKEKAEREAADLRKELAEQKTTLKEFQDFQNTILENTKKRHAEEITRLKSEKKQAAKDGDVELMVEIDEKIEEMAETSAPAPEPAQAPAVMSADDQKVWDEWTRENSWYGEHAHLKTYADGYAQQLVGQYEGREFLDKMAEGVKEVFPDAFTNPKRSRRDMDIGGPGSGKTGGKSFEDLPAEAQAACRRFEKRIEGFTEAQYLAEYEWD